MQFFGSSGLPSLDATISCRIKKAVVGVTQLLAALVSIHSSTKPVHRLQIRQIAHNYTAPPTTPPTYIRVRAVVWECGEEQTDTQTAVATIHFASAMPHGQLKK